MAVILDCTSVWREAQSMTKRIPIPRELVEVHLERVMPPASEAEQLQRSVSHDPNHV